MNDKLSKQGLKWWMSPRRDSAYQWWWGYQKVNMVRLPESEKNKFLERQKTPFQQEKT
jgi:hypothetical protein